ncbi:hypothetical protein LOTGIDRAFT_127610 [Lottia gigantea]|uniref:Ribitol-5-phosphate transferase n=1 Tax=Lottia gigantea TaxID=225164 RepID=V3ZTB4_LOTGI|nr:hypothetical protein LOTGIDRAFT_127610 [Lottia gigantea]ESO87607.1 hypothetical protein LOTGIDRAFT_127610 [Lottia gigantea]
MRSRYFIVVSFFLLNILTICYLFFLQNTQLQPCPVSDNIILDKKYKLTVILREFEDHKNNIAETVKLLLELSEELNVVVIGDNLPYPPIGLKESSRFHVISLEPHLFTPLTNSRPEQVIDSEFVLLLPDSTMISSFSDITNAMQQLSDVYNSLAIPLANERLMCNILKFDVKKWFLVYSDSDQTNCDIVIGNHAILTKSETLFKFSHPFTRPIFSSFYIQNSLTNFKTKLYDKMRLNILKEIFQDPHEKWKHKKYEELRQKAMYKSLGIKLVKYGERRKEWYGCSKETTRCFDTVVNDMPEYLYQGRWTPPCCLRALKQTYQHVLNVLTKCKVRFWLEGGSLLGAVRQGNIIPWDYDIDIGLYKDDLSKCEQFQKVSKKSFIDEGDFLWEKAIEGDFFRVQYSESNRLHVDMFPFYSRDGVMTKDTWMKTHRQDTEFPERFLKPLTSISFLGIESPAPNNVKEFLEFKFGKGVIENPKYPNMNDPIK